jgi:hypothetical protein
LLRDLAVPDTRNSDLSLFTVDRTEKPIPPQRDVVSQSIELGLAISQSEFLTRSKHELVIAYGVDRKSERGGTKFDLFPPPQDIALEGNRMESADERPRSGSTINRACYDVGGGKCCSWPRIPEQSSRPADRRICEAVRADA